MGQYYTILFIFVCSLLLISYFVKYPDTVTAPISITTEFPPQKVISKSLGKIEKIFIENFQKVKVNDPLAII
jgi:multidrug efflux pump subunit AcrA (membrane-fusion protein)